MQESTGVMQFSQRDKKYRKWKKHIRLKLSVSATVEEKMFNHKYGITYIIDRMTSLLPRGLQARQWHLVTPLKMP